MTKLIIASLVLFSLYAFAQGDDVTARAGSISTDNADSLSAPLSPVVFFDGASAIGNLVIHTGTIASGDFQAGATFAQGGSVVIDVNDSTIFSGTMDNGAQWLRLRFANGQYKYQLQGAITDSNSGRTGYLVLQTVKLPLGVVFTGSTTITQTNLHLN